MGREGGGVDAGEEEGEDGDEKRDGADEEHRGGGEDDGGAGGQRGDGGDVGLDGQVGEPQAQQREQHGGSGVEEELAEQLKGHRAEAETEGSVDEHVVSPAPELGFEEGADGERADEEEDDEEEQEGLVQHDLGGVEGLHRSQQDRKST